MSRLVSRSPGSAAMDDGQTIVARATLQQGALHPEPRPIQYSYSEKLYPRYLAVVANRKTYWNGYLENHGVEQHRKDARKQGHASRSSRTLGQVRPPCACQRKHQQPQGIELKNRDSHAYSKNMWVGLPVRHGPHPFPRNKAQNQTVADERVLANPAFVRLVNRSPGSVARTGG